MNKHDADLLRRNRRLKRWLVKKRKWVRVHVPPGIRSMVGVVFIIGGVFGMLPVLGFWMIPLGLVFISLDVGPIYREVCRFFGWPGKPLIDLEDIDTDGNN